MHLPLLMGGGHIQGISAPPVVVAKRNVVTLPPIIMEVKNGPPPVVATFQIQSFSTSMILGERVMEISASTFNPCDQNPSANSSGVTISQKKVQIETCTKTIESYHFTHTK